MGNKHVRYKTVEDLKSTLAFIDNELSELEVRGNSVLKLANVRLTMKALFDSIEIEDEELSIEEELDKEVIK